MKKETWWIQYNTKVYLEAHNLTCIRSNILFGIELISFFIIKPPIVTRMKTAKRIVHYIKCTLDYGLYYSSFNNFKLIVYNDND